MDQQAEASRFQLLIDTDECCGGRSLQKSTRLGIEDCAEQIVRSGVTDVELDGGIEFAKFNEIGGCLLYTSDAADE